MKDMIESWGGPIFWVALIIGICILLYYRWHSKKVRTQTPPPGNQNPGGAAPNPNPAPAATPRPAGYVPWYRMDKHIGGFGEKNPKILLFGIWVIFLYVAAIYFYPEAAFLLSFKWFGILLLLLAMVAILCKGVDLLKGRWITVLVFVLLTVALIDPGLIRNFPDEFKGLYRSVGLGSACSGITPTAPKILGSEWETLNPDNCDLTYNVISGTVIFDGPSGREQVSATSNVVGRRNYLVLTKARALSASAQMFFMLCPTGKSPVDGSWKCRF